MMRNSWGSIAALCLVCSSGFGAGFQLYTEGSAEALGQAGAISGRDGLTSLAWYNPAALAGYDQSALQAGAVFVQIQTDFNSSSSPADDASMDDKWRLIPHFYYVMPIDENLTGLLSINAPYGLITEWPADWAGNLAATYSEFSALYITPSLAYRISDGLAVAGGVNLVHSDAELSANRPAFGERTVTGDNWSGWDDWDDLGYGYTVSVHGKLHEDWAVGARYQSSVKIKLDGNVDFDANPLSPGNTRFDGNAEIELPSSINAGIANASIEGFHIGLDVVWTEWSTYEQLVYNFGADYPVVFPNPEVNSKRWDDVWSIRIGGEYALSEGLALRAGYVWDQSPVNDATRAPELPGSDRQMVMAGIGWTSGSLGIDLAYSYLWAEGSRTGSEVIDSVPALNGYYDTVTHIVGLSGHYAF